MRTLTQYKAAPIIMGKQHWRSRKQRRNQVIAGLVVLAALLVMGFLETPDYDRNWNGDFYGTASEYRQFLINEKGK